MEPEDKNINKFISLVYGPSGIWTHYFLKSVLRANGGKYAAS